MWGLQYLLLLLTLWVHDRTSAAPLPQQVMEGVRDLNAESLRETLRYNPVHMLVEYYSPRCPWSKLFVEEMQVLATLVRRHHRVVRMAKMDITVPEAHELKLQHRIRGTPTLVLYERGRMEPIHLEGVPLWKDYWRQTSVDRLERVLKWVNERTRLTLLLSDIQEDSGAEDPDIFSVTEDEAEDSKASPSLLERLQTQPKLGPEPRPEPEAGGAATEVAVEEPRVVRDPHEAMRQRMEKYNRRQEALERERAGQEAGGSESGAERGGDGWQEEEGDVVARVREERGEEEEDVVARVREEGEEEEDASASESAEEGTRAFEDQPDPFEQVFQQFRGARPRKSVPSKTTYLPKYAREPQQTDRQGEQGARVGGDLQKENGKGQEEGGRRLAGDQEGAVQQGAEEEGALKGEGEGRGARVEGEEGAEGKKGQEVMAGSAGRVEEAEREEGVHGADEEVVEGQKMEMQPMDDEAREGLLERAAGESEGALDVGESDIEEVDG